MAAMSSAEKVARSSALKALSWLVIFNYLGCLLIIGVMYSAMIKFLAKLPVIDFYRSQGKLACVHGVGSMDEVFTRIIEVLAPTPDVG